MARLTKHAGTASGGSLAASVAGILTLSTVASPSWMNIAAAMSFALCTPCLGLVLWYVVGKDSRPAFGSVLLMIVAFAVGNLGALVGIGFCLWAVSKPAAFVFWSVTSLVIVGELTLGQKTPSSGSGAAA
jgi:hypothetical protein